MGTADASFKGESCRCHSPKVSSIVNLTHKGETLVESFCALQREPSENAAGFRHLFRWQAFRPYQVKRWSKTFAPSYASWVKVSLAFSTCFVGKPFVPSSRNVGRLVGKGGGLSHRASPNSSPSAISFAARAKRGHRIWPMFRPAAPSPKVRNA